ncbi:MAG: hypothetical protein ABIY70_10085 [Capsulimonas sp.]|uniref:hypothetical protein n=1 Tax=Capsulimonas sp. TaxID=2494211 RepID=UPI003266E163
MFKRVANTSANILLAFAALVPAYLSLRYLLFDRLKPNSNYPKMQNDLGGLCIAFHAFLFLVFLRVVAARGFFISRYGGVKGNSVWVGTSIGLFAAWVFVFMLGGGANGFLD